MLTIIQFIISIFPYLFTSSFPCFRVALHHHCTVSSWKNFSVSPLTNFIISIRQYDNASLQQHVSTSPLENITASLFPCLKRMAAQIND